MQAEALSQEQSGHHKTSPHHRHHRKRNDCSCNRQEHSTNGSHERFAGNGQEARSVRSEKAQMKEVFKKNQPQG